MKTTIEKQLSRFFTFLLMQLFALRAMAQEKGLDVDVDIDKGGDENWYSNPWVLVGAGAFIIILVLALRGKRG